MRKASVASLPKRDPSDRTTHAANRNRLRMLSRRKEDLSPRVRTLTDAGRRGHEFIDKKELLKAPFFIPIRCASGPRDVGKITDAWSYVFVARQNLFYPYLSDLEGRETDAERERLSRYYFFFHTRFADVRKPFRLFGGQRLDRAHSDELVVCAAVFLIDVHGSDEESARQGREIESERLAGFRGKYGISVGIRSEYADLFCVSVAEVMVIIQRDNRLVAARRHEISVAAREKFFAHAREHGVDIEDGFSHTVSAEHTETAVEEFFAHSQLVVAVAEQPVAESRQLVVIFEHVFRDVRALETGIAEQIAVRGRRVPFGKIYGKVAEAL